MILGGEFVTLSPILCTGGFSLHALRRRTGGGCDVSAEQQEVRILRLAEEDL